MDYKSYKKFLTKTQIKAIDYIGSHRKTGTRPSRKSCPVSVRTANTLKVKGLVMDIGDGDIMLTYHGERIFTELHPYSKWRIK